MTDYPAAHSMDTVWYAVDAVGHVAVFESGKFGHVPAEAEDADYLSSLFRARRPDADPVALAETLAGDFGFFQYGFGEGFDPIDVYRRRVGPSRPAHVDQLPPEMRDWCKKLRLPIRFAEAERVQPLEFFDCAYLPADRAGYVAADGETIRPIPGKEHQFADMVRRLRTEYPEKAARYRFEGVDDGP